MAQVGMKQAASVTRMHSMSSTSLDNARPSNHMANGAMVPLPSTPGGRDEAKEGVVKSPPVERRVKYKTFILDNCVFEVEPRYDIREVVGHGAYGVVCSAVDRQQGGNSVAAKKIENIFEHRSLAKRTLRELKLLRCFQHENIISLERVMRPKTREFNNVYLVSELMETDLACVIRSPQTLTDEHCQFFIYQVLRGLKYIHSANVIHRDLKPRNLLVNSNCDLKICDFGLARVDDPRFNDRTHLSDYIATRWYRAPEVILSKNRYTKAVDLWSVGCILAELIGRKPLFAGRDSFHQITLIISILGTPDLTNFSKKSRDYIQNLPKKPKIKFSRLFPQASEQACDLLEKLLTFDPEKRIRVEDALRHPYLADLHCQEDEPTCDSLDMDEFQFEHKQLSKEELRELMYNEIVTHYPEDTYECTDVPNTFKAMMKFYSPPNKPARRRMRRKSI